MKFYYVYIHKSEIDEKRFYTGFTEDLDFRLKSHNSGGCHHTSKYRSWCIKTALPLMTGRETLSSVTIPLDARVQNLKAQIVIHINPHKYVDKSVEKDKFGISYLEDGR